MKLTLHGLLFGTLLLLSACHADTPSPAASGGAGGTGAGAGGASSSGAPIVEVGVVSLSTEAVPITQELAGRTVASLSADVRPQVGGIIKSRHFEEGALVKAGDLLYEIDPTSYQAAARQAQAAWRNAQVAIGAARLKHERYQKLLPTDGVSKQDADEAKVAYQQALAAAEQARAAYEVARINLDYTRLRAPIGGRIGISSVTPGALVTAGQTTALATIRTLDPIYVDLTQSSAALLKLRRALASSTLQQGSTTLRLKLEDGSAYEHAGTLRFAEVAVDEATGSVTLRAEFPNPEGTLLPGMYVRAVLDQAVAPHAILAPQQGVSRDARGNAVALVVDEQDTVQSRRIVTAQAIGDRWLVTEGLRAGERLIVQGTNKVRVGTKVRPVPLPAGNSTPAAESAATGASAGTGASTAAATSSRPAAPGSDPAAGSRAQER